MVYVDEFGWVYVSDMENHRVVKWAQGGTTGQIVAGGNGAGSMLNQLHHPHGIALDAYGALIVVDHSNHRVMRWANGSTQGIIIAGGQGAGSQSNQLNGPAGLTIGYDGTLYIADYYNNRIQAWPTGSVTGSSVASGNRPWGLAIDASATLYFTSRASNQVMQWRKGARTGRVIVGYNGASHVVGSLNDPTGLCVDSKGGICVAERGYGSIHYVKPENLIGKPYQALSAGTYTAKIYTYGGCMVDVAGSMNFVPQAIVTSNLNGQSCGDTLMLHTNQQIGLTYQWQKDGVDLLGDSGLEFRTITPGSYRLKVVNQANCITYSNDFQLKSKPEFRINSVANCPNDTSGVHLGLSSLDSNLSAIVWFKNGIPFDLQEPKFSSALQQLNQVQTSYHPWWGWNSNLNSPHGIHVDREGNVYVADTEFDRIVKWLSSGGQGIIVAGGNGRGSGNTQLDRPLSVFVDERGWIYASDQGNHRVSRWIPGQGFGTVVAGGRGNGNNLNQLSNPHGIWVNQTGDLFVSDHGNHRIVKWIPGSDSGQVVAGGNGAGPMPNQLHYPAGISLNLEGDIFVADRYNHRIQRWSVGHSSGVTVAGGQGSGSGRNQLSYPWDVSI
ncbi:MAG: NHL repeat-containing protein, partial [Bacteroidota bacterium]